ncbi:MAG TPA: sodium:proton antiporter [bacterium]|nr:sodium:proton antiporter [bacterium]
MLTVWGAFPFVLLLLAIAVLPLLVPHWWHRRYPLVVALLSLPVLFGYLFFARDVHRIGEVLVEYLGFIALIGSLYVIAGGVFLRIVRPPTPVFNTLVLFVGALIANVIGTTGASMLLIRSFLNNNRRRYRAYLVVFFIFVVANIGGGLTPIGDPPLLIGYLKGVPFFWVAGQTWYLWLAAMAMVLGAFYWLDRRNTTGRYAPRPLRIHVKGYRNVLFLAIVLIAVFARTPVRELLMICATAASFIFTPRSVHRENHFSIRPIIEVAVLFAGIFVTMAPVLDLVDARAHGLGLGSASGFYWVTGMLSGILDSAPAYRTFFEVALGLVPNGVRSLLSLRPELVRALSIGAVNFGALTYIGNAPNLMIKAIAEHQRLKVPHFFEYVFRYSLPILLPILVATWLLLLM